MLTKKFLLVVVLLISSTTAAPYNDYYSENDVAPLVSSESAQVIPDSYIVVFKKQIDSTKVDYHHSCIHNYVSEERRILSKRGLLEDLEDMVSGIKHVFNFENFQGYSGRFSNEILDKIRRSEEVAYVEKDQIVYATETEHNAPWGLARISHRKWNLASFSTYLYDKRGGEGVTVYVIDTGVNIDHVDFQGRATWGITVPQNDEDADGNGHGTHVAGTVAGNRYGVSKKAKIVAIKVLRSNGSGTMSDVIKGVEYAAQFHLKEQEDANREGKPFKGSSANMSLGGGKSNALDDAVDGAVDLGLNFAVAAGNDNRNACDYSPAASLNSVTVGASTSNDDRAWFSNHGPCVDVFAPGLDILSAWIGSRTATNRISGTSMASPHVAGLMAYFLSLEPEDSSEFFSYSLSPQDIKNKIIQIALQDALDGVAPDTPNLLIYNGYEDNVTM